MSVTTTPHLNVRGQAREALEHYAGVFGGTVTAVTFAQGGDERDAADGAVPDQLKWGGVEAPNGFRVMAYDVPPQRPLSRGEDPVFLSVRGDDAEELQRCFAGLAEGGTVRVPLGPSAHSPLFGMVTDRFGTTWVLDLAVAWDG